MPSLRDRVQEQLSRRFDQIRREAKSPLPDNMFAPVFDHLDAIIDVVAGMRDYSTQPYLDKVRQVVCVDCCVAEPGGRCAARDTQACGLDAYFPTIVGIIEREFKSDSGTE